MSEEKNVSPFEQAMIDNAGFETPAEPVSAPTVDEPAVEPAVEPSTAEPVVETPVVETPVEPSSTEPDTAIADDSTPPAEPVITEPEVGTVDLDDWDAEVSTEEPAPDVPKVEGVLKEFGFEGLTIEQAKEKVEELRNATTVDPLAGLPDNLKKAIQIANDNGDYLEYLGVTAVDYSNVDERVLLENNLASFFVDEDGRLDKEGFQDYMDALSDKEIEIKGKQLKLELIERQKERVSGLEVLAGQRREKAEKDLKMVLDSVDEIRGFKLKPSHKKTMYEDISSGNMINEMFYDKTGNMDFNKVVKAYFDYKWGDRAADFLKQHAKTSAKKQILNELGNAQVNTSPPELPNAVPEQKTPQDYLADHLAKGGFGN